MVKSKFRHIYDELTRLIQSGEYTPKQSLPSENELAETYKTSRETIRKALKLLSEHGYIQKVRGKGSIVLDTSRIDFPVSGLVSFQELAKKMGTRAETKVVTLRKISSTPFLQEMLERNKPEDIWELHRVRRIDGEKIILDKDYLLVEAVPTLPKKACEKSIYAYIENELGQSISFARKEITVEKPTEEDKQLLDLHDYETIVVVKSQVYLEDTTLFQYTESRHRPDKFRFVDFARRY